MVFSNSGFRINPHANMVVGPWVEGEHLEDLRSYQRHEDSVQALVGEGEREVGVACLVVQGLNNSILRLCEKKKQKRGPKHQNCHE